jgi:hypothetical protein
MSNSYSYRVRVMVFNGTYNNISVLVVDAYTRYLIFDVIGIAGSSWWYGS